MADAPIPIRIPPALLTKIEFVAKQMDRSKQEIMRLAMEIGLEDLKRCNYDLAGAIVEKVHGSRSDMIQSSMLAEPQATNGKPKKKEA
jgi:predicted DNA-binding protein